MHADIEFDWSSAKAEGNLTKHGVSFDEAETCFDDPHACIIPDEEQSDDEPREIIVGYSNRNHLLFVAFVQRADKIVRLVSARKADADERRTDEKNTHL